MKRLVNQLATERQTQVFIATHSSHISSRLDLRKAILLGATRPVLMNELSAETAAFFMKAPDNNVLEFALARRVLLVEGDAEFILIEAFYHRLYGRAPEDDGVHIIAIGGTSFRRYLELARLLENRVAALRDNDGNYQQNCDERYADVLCSRSWYLLTTTTAAPHLKSACIRIMPTCVMRFSAEPAGHSRFRITCWPIRQKQHSSCYSCTPKS